MKKVGVALLGLGTVGGGTYQILTEKKEYFQKTQGLDINIENILEINMARCQALGVDTAIVTSKIAEIASNPNVDIVAEFIGGVEPAKTFILTSLRAGKSVVTANKELFCKHWSELEEVAARYNVGLYFEASCVGGVPIIRALMESMQANRVQSLVGIINGTTNYILTKMCDEGASYDDVLKQAQQLGYAEANPTADVEGYDAGYKLSILSSLCFFKHVTFENIYREGITKISPQDIAIGKSLGYTVKLLAIAKQREKGIEVRIHPAFIPMSHPLANVKGSYNAVLLQGDAVGEIMLYGMGAGALPTGSAIVSDIIYAANQQVHKRFDFVLNDNDKHVKYLTDFKTEYYIRCTVVDEPGVLAKVSSVFAKHDVSITDVMQKAGNDKSVPIIFITHKTHEKALQKAVAQIEALPEVLSVDSIIRVEK